MPFEELRDSALKHRGSKGRWNKVMGRIPKQGLLVFAADVTEVIVGHTGHKATDAIDPLRR